jgi:hypothetical protein
MESAERGRGFEARGFGFDATVRHGPVCLPDGSGGRERRALFGSVVLRSVGRFGRRDGDGFDLARVGLETDHGIDFF